MTLPPRISGRSRGQSGDGRCGGRRLILARADDEQPALVRDVPHAHLPHVALVDSRRAPDVEALRVHCRAQQRHVVLPANRRADAAGIGLHRVQRRAVALTPDQALHRGRHELAMLAGKLAARGEEQSRAVERRRVALDHADDQRGSRCCARARRVLRSAVPAPRSLRASIAGKRRVLPACDSRRARRSPHLSDSRRAAPRASRPIARRRYGSDLV